MSDNINPDHYKNSTSLECIEVMQMVFGRNAIMYFCLLNSFKYLWRWKNKNGKEDLNKAEWYISKGRDIINDIETSPALTKYSDKFAEMAIYIEKAREEIKNESTCSKI